MGGLLDELQETYRAGRLCSILLVASFADKTYDVARAGEMTYFASNSASWSGASSASMRPQARASEVGASERLSRQRSSSSSPGQSPG